LNIDSRPLFSLLFSLSLTPLAEPDATLMDSRLVCMIGCPYVTELVDRLTFVLIRVIPAVFHRTNAQ
jgi:hypothetical protein